MTVFDLHCDTLYELYKRRLPFQNSETQISYATTAGQDRTQVFAIWSEHKLSEDACWEQFQAIRQYYDTLCMPEHIKPILAVEGGKLLAGDIHRLSELYDWGIRILTLVWQDHCCVGGAWNTSDGLSPFGRQVIDECFSLGMQVDISHASDRMFWECAEMAEEHGEPLIASHSNSRTVCPHRRNLTNEMFEELIRRKGLVGISMAAVHLAMEGRPCTLDTILLHIEQYLSRGGENILCLGCDFDGIAEGPKEIQNAGDLPRIADALARIGYSDSLIEKLFYRNAKAFFERQNFSV